jgi:hypothetical protein
MGAGLHQWNGRRRISILKGGKEIEADTGKEASGEEDPLTCHLRSRIDASFGGLQARP